MLESVPAQQIAEWEAWMRVEHIGTDPHSRHDLSAAIVAQTIANSNRGKDTKPIELEKFMPEFREATDDDGAGGDPWRGLYNSLGAMAKKNRRKKHEGPTGDPPRRRIQTNKRIKERPPTDTGS